MNEEVLIVEDTDSMGEMLQDQLERAAYRTRACNNGKDALEVIRDNPPDIVLMDLIMPGMDGAEACQRIKQNARTAGLPVIILSASRGLDNRIRALDCGADDFLSKPWVEVELLARIRSQLRNKNLRCELEASYRDLKKMEELKDGLTRLIIHDLKSPLAGIQGWADMLKAAPDPLSQKQLFCLGKITKSCETELRLITDLLDITLMEESRFKITLSCMDLAAEAHGGTLKAETAPGGGTAFRLTLPGRNAGILPARLL